VPVPVLRARLFFAVLTAWCSGDDPKLPGPFPILSGSVTGFGAGLGFGVAAVAVVAVGGRKRGFALDAAQHDQVDEAAIPALLGQVTAREGMHRDCRLHATPAPQHAAPRDAHVPSQADGYAMCRYVRIPRDTSKCSRPSVSEGNNTMNNIGNNNSPL